MMERGRVARRSPTLTHVHLGQDWDASRSAPLGTSARGKPEAPVSRPEGGPGPITLQACHTRHTGPQEGAFGDALRLIAVARKPGSAAKSRVNQRVG